MDATGWQFAQPSAAGGCVGLAAEVVWTRLLIFFLQCFTFTFSAMLAMNTFAVQPLSMPRLLQCANLGEE